MSDLEGSKVCRRCGAEKPWGDYHDNSRAADGLATECRDCVAERGTAYRARKRAEMGEDAWRAKNAGYARTWRERSGGKTTAQRAYDAAYRRASGELRARHAGEFAELLAAYRSGPES